MPSHIPSSASQRVEPALPEDRNAPFVHTLAGLGPPGAQDRDRVYDTDAGRALKYEADGDGAVNGKSHLLQAEETAAAERIVVESRSLDGARILRVVDARGYIARSVAIMGLVGVALIHLLDSGSKFAETPYVFWMYVALMVASLGVAGLLLHTESWRTWAMAGGLAGSAIVGYVLSRTTGLPGAGKDVGNWSEPLGLAALFIEGCIVALALYRLFMLRPARLGDNQVR
ncbi:MAG TPA: hypothetical protein DEV93_01190 [Chloroflexi bacterium]|nr:hypothetical protein [Chloroflexota bacterium]